jgi:tetratricopeptide (TPR) repeat protein
MPLSITAKYLLLVAIAGLTACSRDTPDAFEPAMAAYRANHYPEANRLFADCIARQQHLPESLFYWGRCLTALDSLPQAAIVLEAALKAHDEARSLHLKRGSLVLSELDSSNFTAVTASSLGDVYYRLDKYPKAFNAFYVSYLLKPDQPGINFNLGVTLLMLHEPHRAASFLVREYQQGTAAEKECSALAEAYLLQHNYDSARIFLRKALQLYPGYAPALALQQEIDEVSKIK